ncbi:MAG: peptidylprolyl isomerase [Nitrosomonas sp.]|nr:peptidylprolyl isomerase [Nitrosomonas sp.]MDP1950895.1 peptidylprolyl isomerase [Nitrosomonas sp.]
MSFVKKNLRTALFAGLFSLSTVTQANPVACFKTNTGDFCMELLETYAPKTVANFLEYLNNGAYTSGILHRSVPDFVIQAGGFKIISTANGNSLAAVETFPPIANEFKISNTRSTVAMAKVAGDPDSATSEWFVNLADNAENLNNQNGGFTVFGRIIFDGMTVIDTIGKLPVKNLNLGNSLTEVPIKDSDNTQVVLVVTNSIEVTETSGIFSEGFLSFAVDIGAKEHYDVNLQLTANDPDLVFELVPASVRQLQTTPAHVATFSSQAGILFIPSVMIDAATVANNVFMKLTDANTFQFTLQSYELAKSVQ